MNNTPRIHTPSRTQVLHRLMLAWVAALALITLAACHDDDSADTASATTFTTEIGPAGGTLTAADGTQVVIPAGALDEATTIGIQLSSSGSPDLPEDVSPGPIYEFTPHDVVFNAPVTIRMPVPNGADGTEVFMASPGGEWQSYEATVTGGFAEWQRNSFSWGLVAVCAPSNNYPYSSTSPDPYPCSSPRGGANATATPAQAITRIAYDYFSGNYSGSAGSWTVTEAGTVHLTLNYRAAPDCENGHVKLIRWNPADPLNTPNRVQTLFDQAVPLTQTPFPNPPGIGGTHIKAAGSTTVDVAFSHLNNGTTAFGFTFSCNRPFRSAHTGGDLLTFVSSIPVPSVTHTIGGMVSGLTGTGLVLQNNGGDNLPVTADGAFTFASAIADNAPYSVSVHTQPSGQICTLQNESGTALADVSNVAVSCVAGSAAKAWQGAALLETLDAGDAFESQVAFDANGNAFAVWSQPAVSGGKFRIWTSRYEPGTGWGSAAQIQITDTTLDYRTPQIAFDANGDAIVVFAGFHPDGSETWAARYSAANSSWGAATQLTANGANPQIAIDTSGNAMVVWQSWNGGAHDIEARRYVASTSAWEPAQLIETNAGPADAPQIALDANGNAMVVWSQWDVHYNIWANRYVAGAGWGAATLIEASDGEAGYPQIATSAAGNAMAVWQQHDGTTTSIYSNRYSAGSWGSATLVESSGDFAEQSSIAINGSDNAIVVWSEVDSGDVTSVWARGYAAGVGGTAVRIDDLSVYTSGGSPQVAIDASGNAMAVWNQDYHIWANRYVAGTGWSGATLIDSTTAGGSSSSPQIAVDGNGNALAVWSHSGVSAPDVWGNVFK